LFGAFILQLLVAVWSEKTGDQQGEVQGLAGSSGAVASVSGWLLGGIAYSSLQGGLFYIAAALVFLVTLLALLAHRKIKRGV
jgi:predicted MFS family arabinose efflux permease